MTVLDLPSKLYGACEIKVLYTSAKNFQGPSAGLESASFGLTSSLSMTYVLLNVMSDLNSIELESH